MMKFSAISDLVYTYINTSQYDLAKKLIIETIPKATSENVSARKRSQLYNNLGITYKKLEKTDSAALAYEKALDIKSTLEDSAGMADLKINLAALHIKLDHFAEAINLSDENIVYLRSKGNYPDLIYNLINKAGGHYGLLEYNKAFTLLEEALEMAKEIGNGDLIQIALGQLSIFHKQQGQFQKAFEYLVESNKYKVEFLNADASAKIAELRESFEAEQREKENLLLTSNLEIEKNRKRLYFWGLFSMALLAGIISWFLVKNRTQNLRLQLQNDLISDQKDKLTQLNTEKNNLISIVSHDLSSPLSAIKIWAQGITQEPKEEFEEARSVILKTANKALQSVRKILQVEVGEMRPLEIEEVSLVELLETLQRTFGKQAKEKGLVLDIPNHEDLIFVTDREMLLRALENLISNAIKFSSSDTKVSVTSNFDDHYLQFNIIDEGPGIPKEEQDSLFSKFFQASPNPTAGEPSSGLGLHIVKRIADELGAIVSVDSEPQRGSTFSFRLAR